MDQIERMIRIGRAMVAMGLQNTHSGNLSVRRGDKILITRSGSMKGRLTREDIVILNLTATADDDPRASVETGTHRGVLQDFSAVVHAHSVAATILSILNQEIDPVDFLGARLLRSVPVLAFDNPVGSEEMAREIPPALKDAPAVVVKSHGPFARADDLLSALRLVSILDFSCDILLQLHRWGSIQSVAADFPVWRPQSLNGSGENAACGEGAEQIATAGTILFDMGLSPFSTGWVAVRSDGAVSYSDGACLPPFFKPSIGEIRTGRMAGDFIQSVLERVFGETDAGCAVLAHSVETIVEGLRVHTAGREGFSPIDAEGRHLYPFVPVISARAGVEEIVMAVAARKVTLIAGMGVLAVGADPSEALRHVSAMKNICAIKSGVDRLKGS